MLCRLMQTHSIPVPCFFFFLIIRRPRRSTLFPSTTLFRSRLEVTGQRPEPCLVRLARLVKGMHLLDFQLGDFLGSGPDDGSALCVSLPGKLKRVLLRRSEEHTSELQSQSNLVCRLLLVKKE